MALGKKTGGRQKGTPNQATAAKAAQVAASGLTPLDFMLDLMRDPLQPAAARLDAAKSAAPYVHPRLSPIDDQSRRPGDDQEPLVDRLKRYSTAEAIEASDGKVVNLLDRPAPSGRSKARSP